MYDVVTIGDSFEDIFLFPKTAAVISDSRFKSGKCLCFGYGDKIEIEKVEYHVGGSAANTAINFSRLGVTPALITAVGIDSQGERILNYFLEKNLDTSLVQRESPVSNLSIILSFSGDRTILTYHNIHDYSNFLPKKSLKTRWYYLAPIGGDSDQIENRLIENIAKEGAGLIWNPGWLQIKKYTRASRHLLRLCNLIFLNREEALEFVDLPGKQNSEAIMKEIHSCGVKIVVITDGKNGAKCFDGEVFYKIEISHDERLDATGAGDAFASTFSAEIIKNCGRQKPQRYFPKREVIEQALKSAIIVSGSVVSKIGAQSGLLTPAEIINRTKKLVKLEPMIYT